MSGFRSDIRFSGFQDHFANEQRHIASVTFTETLAIPLEEWLSVQKDEDALKELENRLVEKLIWSVREKCGVIRCSDCAYFQPEEEYEDVVGPNGETMKSVEPPACMNPARCSTTWDGFKGQYVPVGVYTSPDGFCAWASKKEER